MDSVKRIVLGIAAITVALAAFLFIQGLGAPAQASIPNLPTVVYESANAAFGTTSTSGVLDTRKIDELQIFAAPNPDLSVVRYLYIDWLAVDAATVLYRYSITIPVSTTLVTSTVVGTYYSVLIGRDTSSANALGTITSSITAAVTSTVTSTVATASALPTGMTVIPYMLGNKMKVTLTNGTSTQWVWSASTTGAQGYTQFAVYGR